MDSAALVTGVLTWLHVFCAMGWFGGDLVFMLGFDPRLGSLSSPTRGEILSNVLPGLNRLEQAFAGGTVVFGLLLLYDITGGDMSMLSPSSSWGLAVSIGATLGFIAFLLETGVHSPAVRRVIAIARESRTEDQRPGDEMSRHERRAEIAEIVILLLLFTTFTCMIAAGQL